MRLPLCSKVFAHDDQRHAHTCCLLDFVPHVRHECLCGVKEGSTFVIPLRTARVAE